MHMAADDAGPEEGPAWLGQRIKALRIQRGLKLRDIVERSGLSISTLSKIENGRLVANFEKLTQIAKALGTDAGRLLSREADARPTGRRSITRKGHSGSYATDQYVYGMLCADLARKKFLPLLTRIQQRQIEAFGPLLRHEGEEFVYVLEGEVELHTEFYAPALLHAGDSVYFDSTMGHALVSPDGDGVVLWISSMTRYPVEADAGTPRTINLFPGDPAYMPPPDSRRSAARGRGQHPRAIADETA